MAFRAGDTVELTLRSRPLQNGVTKVRVFYQNRRTSPTVESSVADDPPNQTYAFDLGGPLPYAETITFSGVIPARIARGTYFAIAQALGADGAGINYVLDGRDIDVIGDPGPPPPPPPTLEILP